MSTVQRLARHAASLTYGIITLLMFMFLAFRDGSLFKHSTEKEKNELALGLFSTTHLHLLVTDTVLSYSTRQALESFEESERVDTRLLHPLTRNQASLRY